VEGCFDAVCLSQQMTFVFTCILCESKSWQSVPKLCTSCDLAGLVISLPAVEASSIGQTDGAETQAASQATLPQTHGRLTA